MTEKRVTCAVILRDEKALLARRAPGQKNAGLWEFPGGKVDPGESDEACLAREIWEEFGVKGTVGAHICDSGYTYGALDMRILLCAYLFSPESLAFEQRVHDDIRFFSADEMEALPLSPADLPIAARVAELLSYRRTV
ncbi:MAG: (deoxy)nucleoside triphosphate pyrophosphohydrolase [Clostridia bacterium]|nr:(deoxy)nucleoside triphosphate pyrophosphohydrolase [Clostridia bacterium]